MHIVKKWTSPIVIVLCLVLFFCPGAVHAQTLLKTGMENEQVLQLQVKLKQLGYFDADPTGYFGEITEHAVRSFQKAYGLYVDGIVGKNTLAKIEEALLRCTVLKKGMEGDEVEVLQRNLKCLGYFNAEPTGYFGEITEEAVKRFQKEHDLLRDGIVGKQTVSLLYKLLNDTDTDETFAATETSTATETIAARSTDDGRNKNYMVPWEEVSRVFTRGTVAKVYDIETGLSFNVKRTYGDNHSDTETLTKEDSEIMKKIYGGEWSWEKRAIIVEVNGHKFAASMNGMPHAGLDGYKEGAYVNSRSGGYGYGYNHDSIKGNGMDGHFCIHFYGCRLHFNNQPDPTHQKLIKYANEWAQRNYGN